MKQIVQNLRSGVLELMEVPCPQVARGHLLVQTHASLISAGTERSLVEFGKANLLAKARQNPERVKQVLAKIKADGLLPTLEAVFSRLDEPLPLGYCNAGTVVEVGPGVSDFVVGDRVASNGHHAELVHVPTNLCAKIPDEVPDDDASFAVLGSITLQGIRLLQPELGETVVVFGLGLVGLIAVQTLIAAGTRVIGIDLDPHRLRLAESFGADDQSRRGGRPRDRSAGVDPGPRCGRRPDHGQRETRYDCQPIGTNDTETWPPDLGWRRESGIESRDSTKRNSPFRCPARTVRGAMIRLTNNRGRTILCRLCGGPNSEISRRFWS